LRQKVKNIVKQKMVKIQGSAHSYEHVHRVFKIATYIAEKENADVELVQIGALLHDIGRVIGEPHNETGVKLATSILKELNYPQERSEKITKIILHHPLSFKKMLETLEEKIVWDADKIDLLGMIGVARTFHWGGTTNRSFEVVIKFCFDEMKTIYHLLNTQTAKIIAEKRYRVTMQFLSTLEKELIVTDF
jgi:uncharacterized protein